MQIETSELQQLLTAVEEENLSIAEAIERIKGSNGKAEEQQPKPAEEIISLSVNYGRNVKEMIKAGKYDWENSDITEKHFPLPAELKGKTTTISGKLFHFDRSISSEDAISEMDKAGYRPATLPELLALGEDQPDLQRQFPIIALGSVWSGAFGRRGVPGLNVGGYERKLSLYWFAYDWIAVDRFFGVRK